MTSNTANGFGTVDYILYSTVASMFNGKMIEGNLKLLSRLNLLSGAKVKTVGIIIPDLSGIQCTNKCPIFKFLGLKFLFDPKIGLVRNLNGQSMPDR